MQDFGTHIYVYEHTIKMHLNKTRPKKNKCKAIKQKLLPISKILIRKQKTNILGDIDLKGLQV